VTPFDGACEIRAAIQSGQTTAVEVCRAALDRIAQLDHRLHAFLHVDAEGALHRAALLDRASSRDGLLFGVPVAVKDNICTADMPTTAASRVLEGYRPPYNASVVDALQRAGAVIVGKTNCDEFAMGSSTEHSAFRPTANPWALDRVPGGSSGGSAAAVAAGMVPLALGSDTGGSVRQPAALCGVIGLKPTYGRVSRYGLIAFASSLDQIGPFARSARDAAVLLQVLAGSDARDSTSSHQDVPDYSAALGETVAGLRIGVPRAVVGDGVDTGIRARFDASLAALAAAGASIRDIELPYAHLAIPVYYLVANAEASSNLARFDGVRYGVRADADDLLDMYYRTRAAFGAEVKRRIMIGTYVLSAGYYDAFYQKAQDVRSLIRRDYDRAFEAVDVIATPTSPTVAFRAGERTADPLRMYLSDVFTAPANLAGLPAISVPAGAAEDGLPAALQLTGPEFSEGKLLRAAAALEAAGGEFRSARPRGLD
jgi:aspartyl-tRNA(Asn)/glutamyl-tRNA(Gln) amidotransferase subunit A